MKGNPASGRGISLVLVSDKNYASKLKGVLHSISSSYSRICYVSLNKPHSAISESLREKRIPLEKIFFIDCTGKPCAENGQAVSVSSPKALTEMSITIGKVLEMGKIDALIFDSLSTLLIYGETSMAVKFTHSLISALRARKAAGILVCLSGGKNAELVKDISMFTDRVVK